MIECKNSEQIQKRVCLSVMEDDNIIEIERALHVNKIIESHIMAIVHALLWVTALSFAAFFHLSESFSHDQALLLSTLSAYIAYLCESVLGTVKEAAASTMYELDFRKAGLWKWIALNIVVNTLLSLLFLSNPSWIYLVLIILTAGWQKFMDGRIPPRLHATAKPLVVANKNK
ncbi:MAG: hypothetical protein K2N05_11270 [Muribaculaceae bacterium]|nr:hypothetical protein [Muribaculaceae bacterium]